MFLSVFEILFELLVEVAQRVSPLLLAFFDFVQFFFQAGRVLDIENIPEVFDQKVGNDQSDLRRDKLATEFLRILRVPEWWSEWPHRWKADRCRALRVLSRATLRCTWAAAL